MGFIKAGLEVFGSHYKLTTCDVLEVKTRVCADTQRIITSAYSGGKRNGDVCYNRGQLIYGLETFTKRGQFDR